VGASLAHAWTCTTTGSAGVGVNRTPVDGTDLHWLVLWDFAERQKDPDGAVDVFWRVTAAGRAVRLLDWNTLRAWE